MLAVGWQKGWAIWSVGGWCLAWGFGADSEIDPERCSIDSSILDRNQLIESDQVSGCVYVRRSRFGEHTWSFGTRVFSW